MAMNRRKHILQLKMKTESSYRLEFESHIAIHLCELRQAAWPSTTWVSPSRKRDLKWCHDHWVIMKNRAEKCLSKALSELMEKVWWANDWDEPPEPKAERKWWVGRWRRHCFIWESVGGRSQQLGNNKELLKHHKQKQSAVSTHQNLSTSGKSWLNSPVSSFLPPPTRKSL